MQTPSRWLLLLAACAPLAAQETYDLSVHAKKGDRVLFVESTDQLLRVQLPHREASVDNRLEFARLFLVEVEDRKDDGSISVQLTTLRVHGSLTMPMGIRTRFDSAEPTLPGNDEMAGVSIPVRRMLDQAGLRFRADVTRDGQAKGAFVPSAKAPKADDPETAQDVEKMEHLIEAVFGRLPGKKMAVGATWPNEQRTTSPSLPTVRKSEIRFAAADKDTYRLEWTGKLSTNEDVKTEPGTSSITAGTILGVQTIDRSSCTVIAAKTTADAELSLPGAPTTEVRLRVQSTLRRGTTKDVREMDMVRGRGDTSSSDAARLEKTGNDVRRIALVTSVFFRKHGRLPNGLDELTVKGADGRASMPVLPTDGWGNAYVLVEGDEPGAFHIRSNGPDGKAGTADDIDSRKQKR